jgi:single-stranded DNA-binding protein
MQFSQTVVGRAGADPEEVNDNLVRFSVAVNEWDPAKKEAVTTWVRISAFDKLAEIAKANVRQGSMVYVRGAYSVYDGPSGEVRQLKAFEIGSAERFRDESW